MIKIYNRSDERLCELIDKDIDRLMCTNGTVGANSKPAEVYMDDYIRVNCDMKISRLLKCMKDTYYDNNNPVGSNTTKYICDIDTNALLVSYNDRDYWNQRRIELYREGSYPRFKYPDF